LNFIVLNLFPYTSGHLMIVPYQHVWLRASFGRRSFNFTTEMIELAKSAQVASRANPDGFNIG